MTGGYPANVWFSISLLIFVALARLTLWRGNRTTSPAALHASRLLTTATALLGLGFAFQADPFHDWVDALLHPPLAENLSDLIHALCIMTACVLLGSIPLTGTRARVRRPWMVFGVVLMLVVVIASGLGARPIAGAQLYQNTFAAVVLSSCVLIVVTTVRQLRGARLLAALTFAALAAIASAGTTVYTLIFAPTFMQDHYDQILTVTSVLVAVGVGTAGLYGLWLGWRRS
ncbi:hypothetical protein NFA_40510 [Nocardia farcinica IFM 10152]|uniref:DUF998 domain-containing protein n=1 Tax=Nocardia farcinica (strain IFM 10152) TaxID=247156 RepID=Q5YSE2_NOCFA|nr:hypothetical protein NFA_40510 [Nocardia farcinica IFM 10152]